MARRKKYRLRTLNYLSSSSNITTVNGGFLGSRVRGTNATVAEMSRMFDELLASYAPSISFQQRIQEAARTLDEFLETFL